MKKKNQFKMMFMDSSTEKAAKKIVILKYSLFLHFEQFAWALVFKTTAYSVGYSSNTKLEPAGKPSVSRLGRKSSEDGAAAEEAVTGGPH